MLGRFLCLGAFLLLLALGVAACGGSAGKSSPTNTVVDPDQPAKPSPAGKAG
jgi:hypothetical protein